MTIIEILLHAEIPDSSGTTRLFMNLMRDGFLSAKRADCLVARD
jgi:hypothetical protein